MKKYMMKLKDLNHHKIALGQLIRLDNLGYVGFDNEIVDSMIKYDIFPDIIEYRGDDFVLKSQIFAVVKTLLRNSMRLYEAVDTVDTHVEQMAKEISEAVPLTAEELAKVQDGTMTMSELIESKKEESNELTSEDIAGLSK